MTASPRSLADMRHLLAPAIAAAATFDGWSDMAVEAAAIQHGIDPAAARYAFRGGAMDMIAAWIGTIDQAMATENPPDVMATLKIRERIRRLLAFRIAHAAQQREALRRALAIMAMPQNLVRAARLSWHSADAMWRLAGDTATDYNHYTKRLTLGGVYASTLAVLAQDDSADQAETYAFLDRRIDDVMRFEKAKAKLLNREGEYFSPTRFLGRLRYPAR